MKNLNSHIRLGLLILLTVSISFALFGLQYRFNNKYQFRTSQPITGVLMLDQQDLRDHPVRYLIQQWEFYPGILLTPDDFNRKTPDTYRQYVAIGQYSGLNGGNPFLPFHGSATYRLTLSLPEQTQPYALELPEIYSSYRLYINDRLALKMGNPDPASYDPEIRNSIVTFDGSGTVQILLTVTDQSGIYSGLTYPPVFGFSNNVLSLYYIQNMLHLAIFILAFLGTALSFYMNVRSKQRRGLLFALLCICFMGYTSHSLLHTILATTVNPWYPLEILCFYTMLFLVILLQNSILSVSRKIALLSGVISGIVTVLILILILMITCFHVRAGELLSVLASLLKYGTAFYLLSMAIFTSIKAKHCPRTLVITLIFAVSLLADRLMPLYEPIIGGWFVEVGGTILVFGLAVVLWKDLAYAYNFCLSFEQSQQQLKYQIAVQAEHYRQLSRQIAASRQASHDLRHHMRTLRSLAEKNQLDEIRKYLDTYEPTISSSEIQTYSANSAADAVVSYYASTAKENSISFDALVRLPPSLDFPTDELCALLGNLLENAVEACIRQETGKRFIYLRGQISDQKLGIILDNSYDGNIRYSEDHFYSSKRSGSGIGIRSVRSIVERHHGLISFEPKDMVFQVSLMIPLACNNAGC